MSLDTPQIRPIEAVQFEADGQMMVTLVDPLRIARATPTVSLGAFFLITLMDGRHSVLDMQAEFAKRTGMVIEGDRVRGLIRQLDELHFLESDSFRAWVEALLSNPVREASHAGSAYAAEGAALRAQLDSYFVGEGGPGTLPSPTCDVPLRGVMSPHIDFHRGNVAYAHTWHAVARWPLADVYVILGTSHYGLKQPFSVSRRAYATPLGQLPTDGEMLAAIQRGGCGWAFEDEVAHIGEHSIEFQAVMLRYIAGDRPITAVPILVGGFSSCVREGRSPGDEPKFQQFAGVLLDAAKASGKRVCLVAGVDLAHVGPNFQDPLPVTPAIAAEVERQDREMLSTVERVDPEAFYASIQRDGDKRHVCGFGPIYATLKLLSMDGPVKGTLVRYGQAPAPNDSIVSFAGVTFESVAPSCSPV